MLVDHKIIFAIAVMIQNCWGLWHHKEIMVVVRADLISLCLRVSIVNAILKVNAN